MNDLIVKIVSQYNCALPENEARLVTKTRIFSASQVDVDDFDNYWLVTIGDGDIIVHIEKNIYGDEWMSHGTMTALYVENDRGKTTHAIRSFVMLESRPQIDHA